MTVMLLSIHVNALVKAENKIQTCVKIGLNSKTPPRDPSVIRLVFLSFIRHGGH